MAVGTAAGRASTISAPLPPRRGRDTLPPGTRHHTYPPAVAGLHARFHHSAFPVTSFYSPLFFYSTPYICSPFVRINARKVTFALAYSLRPQKTLFWMLVQCANHWPHRHRCCNPLTKSEELVDAHSNYKDYEGFVDLSGETPW